MSFLLSANHLILFFLIHFICIFLFGEFILFPFKPLLLRTQSCQLVCSLFLPLFCIPFHLLCVFVGLGNLHGKDLILLYLGESICMLSWLLSFFNLMLDILYFFTWLGWWQSPHVDCLEGLFLLHFLMIAFWGLYFQQQMFGLCFLYTLQIPLDFPQGF